ncbi:MAG: GTPase ObgE [Desulfovibrionaceae bacterium]|nr:GTPase ObgE [Desulfovibrionaceae bacterium]
MRFVDQASITVRSGKGGNGCASFRRERFIPKGGPDGGDGGKGGDLVLRASGKLLTLYDLRLRKVYEAKNGQPGMGKDRYGKNAEDLVLDLPVGTQVFELNEDGGRTLVADLTLPGQTWTACQGGRGGRGNIHFKSSTNRTPRFSEPGSPGQEKQLRLELKVLADVGLLGLPNAGKSTLLAAVSAARPKVAAYPFTTLRPHLGVLQNQAGDRLVMADIPGLIEGASQGQGLGHDFLKHLERTRLLVHIQSCEDANEADPFAGFALLNEELARFDPDLARKPQVLAINKIDLLDRAGLDGLRQKARDRGLSVLFISALRGDGLHDLVAEIWRRLADTAP